MRIQDIGLLFFAGLGLVTGQILFEKGFSWLAGLAAVGCVAMVSILVCEKE